jgi:DNA polymerase-3 subunit epsilon
VSGLEAVPASSLATRAVKFLEGGGGPAGSLAIVRDVMGIAQANRHMADRIARALLAADPRFGRTPDGRWVLAGVVADSPALDACRFSVVDVETTGVKAWRGDRIIEVAVARLDGTVAFHSLVNPGISVPPFVQGLTGISPDTLRDAPPFEAIADDLLAALAGTIFVAHNARFDWAFVSNEIERAKNLVLQGPRVCTVRLARRLLPDLPRRNLDMVSYHFGIEIEGRHRATGDAVAAARVLGRMLKIAKDGGALTLADLTGVGGRVSELPPQTPDTRHLP